MLCFAAVFSVLAAVWKLIPKPESRSQETQQVSRNTVPNDRVAPSGSGSFPRHTATSGGVYMTKAELLSALRDAFTEFRVLNSSGDPTSSKLYPDVQYTAIATPHLSINSAPTVLRDGMIKGRHFGNSRGRVYLHLRVKASHGSGSYSSEGGAGVVGPDKLMGDLDASNLILLEPDIVKEWSDRSVRLEFPNGYWDRLTQHIRDVAKERQIDEPRMADLEVGYEIKRTDDNMSGFFYQ